MIDGSRNSAERHADLIARLNDKLFLRYDFADQLLNRLSSLARQRDGNLAVVGESGNGKTSIMKCLEQTNPSDCDLMAAADIIPVVYVKLPFRATLAGLAGGILDVLKQTRKPSTPERQLVESATKLLRVVGTRVLIIDEAQNIGLARPNEKDVLINFVKAIGETSNLSLVLVGMPQLLALIGSNRQLSRRFDIVAAPPWLCDEQGENLLFNLEHLIQLDKPSNLADEPKLAEWIFAEAEGTIGDVTKIVCKAAACAITSGSEKITMKELHTIDFTRYSLRNDAATTTMNVSRKTYR